MTTFSLRPSAWCCSTASSWPSALFSPFDALVDSDPAAVELAAAGLNTRSLEKLLRILVSDLPGGGVTVLRYWSSERTLWLRDVFGKPEPIAAPALSGLASEPRGIDVVRGQETPSQTLILQRPIRSAPRHRELPAEG